ncbi:MAG: Peptidase [Caulobacteraceae bacterium]|nr:Peptidase [Caulobacteraceae bacterium]
MIPKSLIAPLLLAAFAAGAALAAAPAPVSSPKLTGAALLPQAKVTLDQAKAIALKARAGTIADQELEKETGGSGLRYSFDIKVGKVIYEVGVDAADGKVLENAKEGAKPD